MTFMSNSKNKVKEQRESRLFATILVALSFAVSVFIATPIDIYLANAEEFVFGLGDFFPLCLLFGVLSGAAVFSLLYFVPEKAYRPLLALFAATDFLLFFQSALLNGNMNTLAGDEMAGNAVISSSIIFNFILWIVIKGVMIGVAFVRKNVVQLVLRYVCILMALISLIFMVISPLSRIGKSNKDNSNGTYFLSTANLTDFASDNNVFVFVVDRFDELFAEEAYEKVDGIYSELEGFTWFQDNLSLYGHTFPSIAYMLTGNEYQAELFRSEFLKTVYDGDTPLKRLHDNGYSVNLYTQAFYAYTDAAFLPDYISSRERVEKRNNAAPLKLSMSMVGIGLYRSLPFVSKNLFVNINSNTSNGCIEFVSAAGNENYSTDNKAAYYFVRDKEFTVSSQKNFSFIHIEGCHNVDYDDDWNRPSGSERGDITLSVKSSFKLINKYISEMKAAGVYDNATIIITGDHSAPVKDYTDLDGGRITALFVKPSGESSAPLKISSAQVSHDNLWATIFKSEGIAEDYGKSVFDVPENEDQIRRYVWQTYMASSMDEYVYEITGAAKNFNNWEEKSHVHYEKCLTD